MIKKNLIILCYHGVIDDKKKNGIENYSGKHILKKEFTKQLKFLKKNFFCHLISCKNIKKKFLSKKFILYTLMTVLRTILQCSTNFKG